MLTTCKHGANWHEMKDERCDSDNQEYDKYDYNELLQSSKFCLVPRGRRLATYRLLESLKQGCVPVLLSNNYVLPFSEIIDWKKAAVFADELLLSHVPSMLREINDSELFEMRRFALKYYQTYFSSVERIIATTFEVNIFLENYFE